MLFRRIRDNEYEFPSDRNISGDAQMLIQHILTPDPQMRPTLHEILDHDFFVCGIVPGYIPTSAHDAAPDFKHISKTVSAANLSRLRRYALLDDDQATSIGGPRSSQYVSSQEPSQPVKTITSSIAQQEKEFQKAVQPGSPISALLSSARQPLMMGPAGGMGGNPRESPLFRKLQASRESPLRGGRPVRGGVGVGLGAMQGIEEERAAEEVVRKKELESQKARIVAQMVPVREESREREREVERENVPPVSRRSLEKGKEREKESLKEREAVGREREQQQRERIPREPLKEAMNVNANAHVPQVDVGSPPAKMNGFDAAAHVLSLAFDAKALGKVFRDPREDPLLPLPDEKVFIVSWVDYCNKYGMGYALTDGSVGVHFNDSTSLVLSPDKQYVLLFKFPSSH